MELISGVASGPVYRPVPAAGAEEPPKVQRAGEGARDRPLKPVMDEYVPEEPREPSGRYWLGKDEEGQPKIYFDDPEREADAPEPLEDAPGGEQPEREQGVKGPEKKEGEEVCEGNTDKVDREIEKLKKKREELEQRLNTETDEARIKDLERQLAQVDRELKQKDNDTYRRQHTQVTKLS